MYLWPIHCIFFSAVAFCIPCEFLLSSKLTWILIECPDFFSITPRVHSQAVLVVLSFILNVFQKIEFKSYVSIFSFSVKITATETISHGVAFGGLNPPT